MRTIPLPPAFLDRPLAHRALHDIAARRPENSRAAVAAAVAGGYGIEIDVQMSSDGRAMVFHDYVLDRLTPVSGALRRQDARALSRVPLTGGDEGIPTLRDILDLVAGRVPLLIELKDQDGAMGPDTGQLEAEVAADIAGYAGPVALMSFNPHSVLACADHAPATPRGLTTCAWSAEDWPHLPERIRARLRPMPDLVPMGAGFISHDAHDLSNPHVAAARARGLAVLCWTIRSAQGEAAARRHADNVTFEGYLA